MSIEALPAEIAESPPAARRPGTMRLLLGSWSVVIGAAIVALLAVVGALAPALGTISPSEINPAFRNKKPGAERMLRTDDGKEVPFVHRFGTDTLGRDVYSRVVYGARVSLIIGVTVASLSVVVGLFIGLIAGYIRWLDGIIMRFMDGLMAIPAILLAMGVVSLSRAGLLAVVIAIVIPEIPRVVRLVRAIVLSIREEPYVEAAITVGTPTPTLLVRHVLPNTLAPLIVQGTFICANAILIEAILSFLGIGIPPETPTWGNIMAEGGRCSASIPTTSSIRASSWRSRCSPSTCWATACATRSIPVSPSGYEAHGRSRRCSVLELKGLTVQLPRGSDRAHAIENITLSVGAGEIVCVVGKSGSGKSVTAQTVMGLLPRELAASAGEARLQGEDVLKATPSRLRDLRGTRMAMIFQEPMTALNPVMRVGDQIAEVLEIHAQLSEPDRRQRVLQIMRLVRLPEPERMHRRLSAPTIGRPASARRNCHGDCLQPRSADRRRADNGARRHRRGANPAADPRVAGAARHRRAVHHPRLRRGGGHRPSRGRHAVGPHRRDRLPRRNPQAPPSPATPHADRVGAEPEAARARPQDRRHGAGRGARCPRPIGGKGVFGRGREVRAAENVDITVRRGETVGIVGKSGSGKTTVARCVARLIEPTSGAIRIGDVDVAHLPEGRLRAHRRHVQIVFQDPYRSLNPRRTVGASITEGPVNFGLSQADAMKRASRLMALVGLAPDALDRYPHQFSGGQRQRIAIARALAMEPALLIADEPVSALDVSVQAQVLKLLDDVRRRFDLAVLFITHDLRVAARSATA